MQQVKVIQLCSIGCLERDCKKYLGKIGKVIDYDDTFAEGQKLVRFDNGECVWFFTAELERVR